MAELQGIAGAEAERDDLPKVITRTVAELQVHNKDGVGPAATFAAAFFSAYIVFLANRNGTEAAKGTNQNEAEGADFAVVVDSALANSGAGNQEMALSTLLSGEISTYSPCTVLFKVRRCI